MLGQERAGEAGRTGETREEGNGGREGGGCPASCLTGRQQNQAPEAGWGRRAAEPWEPGASRCPQPRALPFLSWKPRVAPSLVQSAPPHAGGRSPPSSDASGHSTRGPREPSGSHVLGPPILYGSPAPSPNFLPSPPGLTERPRVSSQRLIDQSSWAGSENGMIISGGRQPPASGSEPPQPG